MGACAKKADKMAKLGVGIYKDTITEDARSGKNGTLNVISTVALTVFDDDGKIIKCYLDTLDGSYEFTSSGKYIAGGEELKTKRELGDSYVMSEDKDKLKWYEQADAFAALAKGKTVSEVKKMVTDGGKGTSEVISAGCTITVSDFAAAIELSEKNTEDIMISADPRTDIKIKYTVSGRDATDTADGEIKVMIKAEAFLDDKGDKTPSHTAESEEKIRFGKNGTVITEKTNTD